MRVSRWRGRLLAGCVVAGCLASGVTVVSAQGKGRLAGWVLEDSSRIAIPEVAVSLWRDGSATAVRLVHTDREGRFELELPDSGAYELRAQRLGYAPFARRLLIVDASASVAIRLTLLPVAEELSGVAVTGEERSASFVIENFDRRRKRGQGIFFSRDQLEARGWPELIPLMRGLPGVEIDAGRFRGASGASIEPTKRPCRPVLFVDAVRVTEMTSTAAQLRQALESVAGSTVTAIEIYRGLSELPPEVSAWQARCGAILVWTKRPDDELQRIREERSRSAPDSGAVPGLER